MKVLAIDTSLAATACCIWDAESRQTIAEETLPMLRGHAEALMPLVKHVAGKTPGGLKIVERVAVIAGPGSFTGLRIGISAARAIAQVLNVPAVGVSALSALAAPIVRSKCAFDIVSVIDARHGNVFFQMISGAGKMLAPAQKISIPDAAAQISGFAALAVGNIDDDAFAQLARNARAKLQFQRANMPDIASVAQLGAIADPALAPARPLYLSAADANPAPVKTGSATAFA